MFFSDLATTTCIQLTIHFLELCFEVSQHWKKGERVLKDIKGDVNPKAVKEAFQWGGEGNYEYSEVTSFAHY